MNDKPSRNRNLWSRFFVLLTCATSIGGWGSACADDLSGHWRGQWQSCTDNFKGTVNARITKCGDGRYRVVFTGRAFKIMPYRYTAILTAETDPVTGHVHFRTSRKLPLWGCYWVSGCATGGKLVANYRTDDHTGLFTMCRTRCSQ